MTVEKLLKKGNEEALINMLSKGEIDLKSRYEKNRTLLHLAVRYQTTEVVRYLVSNHPDLVNVPTNNGTTALHLSVKRDSRKNLDITKILIDADANLEAETKTNKRPLHHAALNGCQLQSRLLLQHGAKTNKDTDELSPEQMAKNKSHVRLAHFLARPYVDADASDTDSEDEEDYSFKERMPEKPSVPVKKESKESAEEGVRIPHFRGLHFYPGYMDRKARKSTRVFHKLQDEGLFPRQGTYSAAAHDMAGEPLSFPTMKPSMDKEKLKKACAKLKKREKNLSLRMQTVIDNMTELQETQNVDRCLGRSEGSRENYDSRYLEFVQVYVNSYKALAKKLEKAPDRNLKDKRMSERTREETTVLQQVGSGCLPMVSTSEAPHYGLEYAFALVNWDKKETHKPRSDNIIPLTPMFQPDGHPWFPYLGILYVYFHSPKELGIEENSTRILDLFTKDLIDLKAGPGGHAASGYIRARERAFIGGIKAQAVQLSLEVRVPNFFHDYGKHHSKKYGLDQKKYEYFKKNLAEYGKILSNGKMRNESNFNRIQHKIIEHVIDHYQKRVYKVAEKIATKSDVALRYLGVNSKKLHKDPEDISKYVEAHNKRKDKKL